MIHRGRAAGTRRSLLVAAAIVAALATAPATGSLSAPEPAYAAKPDRTPPAKGRLKPAATPTPTPKPAAAPKPTARPTPRPTPKPAATPRPTQVAPQATNAPAGVVAPTSSLGPDASGVGSLGPKGPEPIWPLIVGGLPLAAIAMVLVARRRSSADRSTDAALEPALVARPVVVGRPSARHLTLAGDPLLEALAAESRQSSVLPEPGTLMPLWVGSLERQRGPRHTVAAIPSAKPTDEGPRPPDADRAKAG